ncbi:MAG: RNA polymerase II transcription factor B 52 kDa subunit [Bogoriella megaspora]|nr:MAG: RNA polymerase II transcription factor B 52 kDa subunit [Bogoriella megaspora]
MSASSLRSLEYLQAQPGWLHSKLYQQPSTVLAVFRRMLPHLAKTFVMVLLWAPADISTDDIEMMVKSSHRNEKDQATSILERLSIIKITTIRLATGKIRRKYHLEEQFKNSLRAALTGGGSYESFGIPVDTSTGKKVTIEVLDAFAQQQWEAILYYMVGSAGSGIAGNTNISPGTRKLLEIGNFIVPRRGGGAAITQAGFTFLLQEVNAQVWSLLIVYLENAESLKMDQVDMLTFLFMLGSLELGQAYSAERLTPTQLHMLDDLTDFGIIFRQSSESKHFYPTRLGTTLTSDAGALRNSNATLADALGATTSDKGYIIIETNYRVYAYTSSPLQIAVLNLFTRLNTRFPNMVSGKLTKESVQTAISYGITSDQIISYLSTHAHPQMHKNNPVLPPTVLDQIRLWQIEGDRMKTTNGYYFKEFNTNQEYQDAARYADNLGVLVWKSDAKRAFFVTNYQQLQMYLKGKQEERKLAKESKDTQR